jgi:predicted nucleic acid-binding protein
MSVYFFDTCALLERYVEGPHARTISRIVSASENQCYVADWTVLEIASALSRQMRGRRDRAKAGGQKFNLKREYDTRDRRVARDLADGKLLVRNTNSRDILHARELIRYSGIVQGNKVDTGDAIVAACCLNLAHTLGAKVIFYTADNGLYRTLVRHDHFRSVMCLRFLGIPKDPSLPLRTC